MRSLLFVPGDDEHKIAKGLASAADALILDLEDAVAADRKAHARELCARTLACAGRVKTLFVRVNALDTADLQDDLEAIVQARPFGIVLPKCRSAEDVRALDGMLSVREARAGLEAGTIRILPIVTETAGSLFGLASYSNPVPPRLYGMMWGGEDLAADLGSVANRGADGRYLAPFELARSLCLIAACAASVIPVDAVYTDFRDGAGLKEESAQALTMGYSAKAAIHPGQIEIINAAFTPSAADVEWAKRVIAAFDNAPQTGVASLDGRMLDRPHYRSARRVLARAGETPTLPENA